MLARTVPPLAKLKKKTQKFKRVKIKKGNPVCAILPWKVSLPGLPFLKTIFAYYLEKPSTSKLRTVQIYHILMKSDIITSI
jgi:hypothetical protein